MKPADVEIGFFTIGNFTISIQRPLFQYLPQEDLTFFEILVTEAGTFGQSYVNLQDDERFGIFKHFGTFTRKLIPDDIVEYNSHAFSVDQKFIMPRFKLSRHSIVDLFAKCQMLSKKKK